MGGVGGWCVLLIFVFCRDLRHLPVLSIDPIGCMDIDDALHAKRLQNGNIEVSYCSYMVVL